MARESWWIDEQIEELIIKSKERMPSGWKLATFEMESGLILHIDRQFFETFSWPDRVRIAEQTNILEAQIKAKGIPCAVEIS